MSVKLYIETLCQRGFEDPGSLTPEERFLYLLVDLETVIEMEGWDHFFMSSRMTYYPDLIGGLRKAGDLESCEILEDYEAHFRKRGVVFKPDAIVAFFRDVPHDYENSCRDWQSDFARGKEVRWNRMENYLKSRGYEIIN